MDRCRLGNGRWCAWPLELALLPRRHTFVYYVNEDGGIILMVLMVVMVMGEKERGVEVGCKRRTLM